MRHSVEKRFGFEVGSLLWLQWWSYKTCSEVSLYRSRAFRRNTETRSMRADLSHHGDSCCGRKQPRDREGSSHFMAVKTAALKQNHFTANQHFPRRSTKHISSCTWFLHYMPRTPTEHNKFCPHMHNTAWLCFTGLISISLPLFLWQRRIRGRELKQQWLTYPHREPLVGWGGVGRWSEKEGG